MNYTIATARQRFAMWAAARAAQAGSAKGTRNELIAGLKRCGVVAWVETATNHACTREVYDVEFDSWVTSIQRFMKRSQHKTLSYGVAAKLVSTYLKCSFVLAGYESTELARHALPPIDSRLLKALDVALSLNLSSRYKWRKLTRGSYQVLARKLRELRSDRPAWYLEEHWEP